MKKLLFVVLVCALMFAVTPFVSANDFFKVDNLEFTGGVTYNTYNYIINDESKTYTSEGDPEELKSGIGYFAGLNYWITDTIGIGAGYENASATANDLKHSLSGPYGRVNLFLNDMFTINANIINYSFKQLNGEDVKYEGTGLGFLIGAEFTYPLANNMELNANAGYRLANIPITKTSTEEDVKDVTVDMNGLRIGIGISYNF